MVRMKRIIKNENNDTGQQLSEEEYSMQLDVYNKMCNTLMKL